MLFLALTPSPPTSPLFPYTTLFRSRQRPRIARRDAGARHLREPGGLFRVVSRVPLLSRLHRSRLGLRRGGIGRGRVRSEEHTSELQSRSDLVCRLPLEKKNADQSHH